MKVVEEPFHPQVLVALAQGRGLIGPLYGGMYSIMISHNC